MPNVKCYYGKKINPLMPGVKKGHTCLNEPATFSCWLV